MYHCKPTGRERIKWIEFTMAQLTDYWSPEIKKTSAFYCVIEVEDDSQKIGYIAVKDTSKELWEIAIELDKAHCGQGCGSKAITLFLKRLNEITTKIVSISGGSG